MLWFFFAAFFKPFLFITFPFCAFSLQVSQEWQLKRNRYSCAFSQAKQTIYQALHWLPLWMTSKPNLKTELMTNAEKKGQRFHSSNNTMFVSSGSPTFSCQQVWAWTENGDSSSCVVNCMYSSKSYFTVFELLLKRSLHENINHCSGAKIKPSVCLCKWTVCLGKPMNWLYCPSLNAFCLDEVIWCMYKTVM